ncbi:histidine phosphatase superfamily [Dichotomocladium elegans]|nr:histidine phosphatase superfamily [Dichotomocladium elegans]
MQPSYNHLPEKLKNHYFIARHGFSLANNAKLICSNPDIAIPSVGGPLNTGWGLHERGKCQVKEKAATLAEHLFTKLHVKPEDIVIFCSPFVRTRQTADIIQSVLNASEPIPNIELRERFYGEYDMTSDENYHLCWQDDASGPDHGEHSDKGVEAPSSVCDRTTQFIVDHIESKLENKTVILVAHGDVCQIMQTAFMRTDAWRHREMQHVDTADWRAMNEEVVISHP